MFTYSLRTILLAAALATATACAGSRSVTGPVDDPALASGTGSGGTTTPTGTSTTPTGTTGGNPSGRIRLEIPLAPLSGGAFPRAKGKAKWDNRTSYYGQRELEIEVEELATGTEVAFFLGGTRVGGNAIVDAWGEARVELSTQRGDNVPDSVSGLAVEVRTSAGVVIVTGMFN